MPKRTKIKEGSEEQMTKAFLNLSLAVVGSRLKGMGGPTEAATAVVACPSSCAEVAWIYVGGSLASSVRNQTSVVKLLGWS